MKAIRTRSSIAESVTLPAPASAVTCRQLPHASASFGAACVASSSQSGASNEAHTGQAIRVRRGSRPMVIRTAPTSPASAYFVASPTAADPGSEVQPAYHWVQAWEGRDVLSEGGVGGYWDDIAIGSTSHATSSTGRAGQPLRSPLSAGLTRSSLLDTPFSRSTPASPSSARHVSTSSRRYAQVAIKHTYEDEHPPFHPPPSPPRSRYDQNPSSSRSNNHHFSRQPPSSAWSSRKLAFASEYADDYDFRSSLADEPGDAGQDDVGWYGDHDHDVFGHGAKMPEMPRSVKEAALRKLSLLQDKGVPGLDGSGGEVADVDALTREDVLAMGATVLHPDQDLPRRMPSQREEGQEMEIVRPAPARRTKLPPLPLPREVRDEEARYDWRAVAPSRGPRKKAKKWYPEVHNVRKRALARDEYVRRTRPEVLDEEAGRYIDHFTLLLEAELAEIRMQHAARLTEWTEQRLKTEGYMLDDMSAHQHRPFRPSDRAQYIYEFRKPGRGRSAMLDTGHHKFKQGACVEISRLHPQIDFINTQGEPVQVVDDQQLIQQYQRERDGHDYELPPYDPDDRLYGTVYLENAFYIRIAFPVPIEGVEQGQWRLDIGHNDFIIRRQIDKLKALYLDPTAQEISDAKEYGVKSTAIPSLKGDVVEDADSASSGGKKKRLRLVLPDQTIFEGSALRDLLLRGFQQTYIPYTASAFGEEIHRDEESGQVTVIEAPVPAAAGTSAPGDTNASQAELESKVTTRPSILMRHAGLADWVKRHRRGGQIGRKESDPELELNESQIKAMAMMLSERLSLVQGPPGTGKTRTIIETIKLLKLHWHIPHPTLVTAHTNAAVDNLAAGLAAHGLKVVRIGAPERIRTDNAALSLEALMEKHPMYADVEKLRDGVKSLQLTISECGKMVDGWRRNGGEGAYASEESVERAKEDRIAAYDKLRREKGKIDTRLAIMRKEILVDADAVCATCLSSVKADLDVIDFPIVFLDEASMATEPLSWLPLSKGASHVVLIGDHKQLPPVITSPAAHLGGLSTSMFERLIRENDVPSIMLDTQYRMHPQISAFPNQAFYAGALHDGQVDASGQAPDNLSPPDTYWLKTDADGRRLNFTFVDTDAPESPRSLSIANEREADLVCDIVSDLLAENPNLRGADIGVITPYAAQISLLEQYLGPGDEIRTKQFEEYLGAERASELADIEIKTVDGFEGREKDVIIFSTVRSNEKGYIGFLADWRRLNVGLTRAKRGMIMLGSARTLSKARIGLQAQETLPQGGAEVWRQLMRHIKEKNLLLSVDMPDEPDD